MVKLTPAGEYNGSPQQRSSPKLLFQPERPVKRVSMCFCKGFLDESNSMRALAFIVTNIVFKVQAGCCLYCRAWLICKLICHGNNDTDCA